MCPPQWLATSAARTKRKWCSFERWIKCSRRTMRRSTDTCVGRRESVAGRPLKASCGCWRVFMHARTTHIHNHTHSKCAHTCVLTHIRGSSQPTHSQGVPSCIVPTLNLPLRAAPFRCHSTVDGKTHTKFREVLSNVKGAGSGAMYDRRGVHALGHVPTLDGGGRAECLDGLVCCK